MGVPSGLSSLLILLALGFVCSPAPAQSGDPPTPSDEIVVNGSRVSTLDLKRLLKAQAVFRNGRAAFAPASTLLFQLKPAAGVPLAGMTLQLRGAHETIPVAIDGEGRFSLPELPEGRWELVHNRGARRIAVRALVLSAGASEADRPLGDLRLQCRVGWELKKASYSLLARGGFTAAGGCASTHIRFSYTTPRPVASATITYNGEMRKLMIRADGGTYDAPLADGALSNGARIHLNFE